MWLKLCFASLLFSLAFPSGPQDSGSTRILLPVEILGANGTTVSRTLTLDSAESDAAAWLSLKVHGIRYTQQASVQWNGGPWVPLDNSTAEIQTSASAFGGIGGAFSSFELRLPIPKGSAVSGTNIIRFRFDHSDGLSSGYRVLAFNLLDNTGAKLLPQDRFSLDSPADWKPPLPDSPSAEAGRALWHSASLLESSLPNSPRIQAHCADCHARDGRDLKYFNYSNFSIVTRSQFHGLTALQGQQIASYVRSLSTPNPGRPWNPPYQPGPGLDAQPVSHWAAGAGLEWVLPSDLDSLSFLASSRPASDSNLSHAITPQLFRPDGNLNAREIPVSLPLPDWNQWLPRIHPKDAWGPAFSDSKFASIYDNANSRRSSSHSLRQTLQISNPDLRQLPALFAKWSQARRSFLSQETKTNSPWSADKTNRVYSAQLWQLVKSWELMQEFSLEDRGQELFGSSADSRTWWNSVPSDAAPVATRIPNGPFGVNGSAVNNEYLNAAWYQLQTVLNSGTHRRRDRLPVDWVYNVSEFRQLCALTHQPEPARLLLSVVKALQSSDPRIGPQDYSQGWRPEQNVDPRVLVARDWAPMFTAVPADVRAALTQSMLQAWLDKNSQYPLPLYLSLPKPPLPPRTLYGDDEISGGKAWLAIDQFRAAGVSADLLQRLLDWGTAYTDRAARIQY